MHGALKHCPFCGGYAVFSAVRVSPDGKRQNRRYRAQICCAVCGALVTAINDDLEDAKMEAFNRWEARTDKPLKIPATSYAKKLAGYEELKNPFFALGENEKMPLGFKHSFCLVPAPQERKDKKC